MKRKYKIVLLTVVLLAAAAAGLLTCLRPEAVEAVRMEYSDLSTRFTAQGTLLPADSRIVSAGCAGTAGEIPFKPGQEIRAGEILVHMEDSSQADLTVQKETCSLQLEAARKEYDRRYGESGSAWSELEAAKQEYGLADREYRSSRIVAEETGSISKMELDQLKARRELAAGRLSQAEEDCSENSRAYYKSRIESYERQLEALSGNANPADIVMPYDGVLWELYLETGSTAVPGQSAAKIYRADRMKIETTLLTEDAAKIAVGDVASAGFSDGTVISARVVYVSKVAKSGYSGVGIEENRCTVELEPEGEIPSLAGAGYETDLTFTATAAAGVLTVPERALVPCGEGEGVYVIRSGKARLIPVTTGATAGGKTEIREGLAKGDVVAADPYEAALKDGKRVKTELDLQES